MKFSNLRLSYVVSGTHRDPLDFPVDVAIQTSPYILKSVDGLDAPDVTVSISGEVFQGRQPQNREVVLLVGFKPNYGIGQTSGDLREQLYRLLTPKYDLPVTLSVQNQARATLVSVTGYVKKIEANIFSKEPQAQITLSCLSPYLKNWGQVQASPGSLPKNPIDITCPGTAPSGFSMRLTFTASATTFYIWDTFINTHRIGFTYNFLSGDVLSFDTTKNQRFATMTRGAVVKNMLPFQHTSSKWLQLHNGVNGLQPSTQNFTLNEFIINPNYWGV